MIRTLIADDHAIFREGLIELLENQNRVKVVGEASDGAETLSKLHALAPDLLILDISMQVLDGYEVLQHIRGQNMPVRVLILSMHNDAVSIQKALQCGADGYMLKDEAYEEFSSAIAKLLAGEKYISPKAAAALRSFVKREDATILSPREKQIIVLIARGRTSKEIASGLGISTKTVETYRQRIMEKLNCHKATDLVRYAMKTGMLE